MTFLRNQYLNQLALTNNFIKYTKFSILLIWVLPIILLISCENKVEDSKTRTHPPELDKYIGAGRNTKTKKNTEIDSKKQKNLETKGNNYLTAEYEKPYLYLSPDEIKIALKEIDQIFNEAKGDLDSLEIRDESALHSIVDETGNSEVFTKYSFNIFIRKKIKLGSGDFFYASPEKLGEVKFTKDKKKYFIPYLWTKENKQEPVQIQNIRYLSKDREILVDDLTLSQSGLGTFFFKEN